MKKIEASEKAFLQKEEKPLPGNLPFVLVNGKFMASERILCHLWKMHFTQIMEIQICKVVLNLAGVLADVGQYTDIEPNLEKAPTVFGNTILVHGYLHSFVRCREYHLCLFRLYLLCPHLATCSRSRCIAGSGRCVLRSE